MPSLAQAIRPVHSLIQEACVAFEQRFHCKPSLAARAPGCVSLLGEHTDYNGGLCLPLALPLVTVIVGNPTHTGTCRVQTLAKDTDRPAYTEFPITDLKKGSPNWCNYVKGVAAQMPGKVPSFDAVIMTSLPMGVGLGSSAALEVATYKFLEQMEGVVSDLPEIQKVGKCMNAEHEFVGVTCGIMNQYISWFAREGHVLLLDCTSQQSQQIPLDDPCLTIVLTNSNVKQEVTGSELTTRRKQCREGAKILGIPSLRDATEVALEAKKTGLDEETFRRVRHVIRENQRTDEAVAALERKDFSAVGSLLAESHDSLRDDFGVSCPELDLLVGAAMEMKQTGVFGSRLTGSGFGGCTVTLVDTRSVYHVIKHIHTKYQETGKTATFFLCPPSPGAKKMGLQF